MADCHHPGCDGDDNLPNTCNFCGGRFCAEHRLPENHYCIPEKPTQDSSPEFRHTTPDPRDTGDDDTATAETGEKRHSHPAEATHDTGTQSHDGHWSGRSSDDTEDGVDNTDHLDPQRRAPSSSDPPTSRSPPVETKAEASADCGPSPAAQMRNGLARMRAQAAYRIRRLRYYFWRTVGVTLTVAKWAFILAGIAAVVGLGLSVTAPGTLDGVGGDVPLGDADLPGVGEQVGANSTSTPTATDTPRPDSTKRERIEAQVHAKINGRRESHGLRPVEKDDALRSIARSHSRDMADRGYFAHESPSGETFEDRYRQAGYQCRADTGGGRYLTGGENIWMMETRSAPPPAEEIAKRAVQDWMASTGHRENILTPAWDDMGIGVYVYETANIEAIYITQNFC